MKHYYFIFYEIFNCKERTIGNTVTQENPIEFQTTHKDRVVQSWQEIKQWEYEYYLNNM